MPILQLRQIDKRFPGVHALRGVDFEIAAGECVALVGENGAGKSTLMKIIGGVYQPDGGEIFVDNQKTEIRSVADAIRFGIGFVHQELNVLDNLDVAANIFLGREPTRGIDIGAKAEIYRLMRELAESGVAILMISSDMEEILQMSDRVPVMHEGRITGILPREECTEENIMRLAVGKSSGIHGAARASRAGGANER